MVIKLQNLKIKLTRKHFSVFYLGCNVLIRVENEMASAEPKHPMHTEIVKINQTITKNIVENFAVDE
jgi:hypothetical protein